MLKLLTASVGIPFLTPSGERPSSREGRRAVEEFSLARGRQRSLLKLVIGSTEKCRTHFY